jgi:DNA mismatch repair protein MutS2
MVLASTHHGLLKAYALTHEGIGAASFEFDPRNYAPTYRIVEGAAGRSLAFEMAERLGLPRPIVNRARALESERERQVGELVSRLEAETAELEQERLRLAEDRKGAEESRLRLEAREEEERQERRRRLSAFRASLEEEVESTRRELREVVAEAKRAILEIRASRQEDRARLQELEKTLSNRIEASTAPLLEKAKAETPREAFPVSPDAIRPGTRVLVASFGMEGIVERIAGDEAEVTVRDKKLKLPVSSLEALPPLAPTLAAHTAHAAHTARGATSLPASKRIPEELNLIGCTVEEALSQADKFLDDALLSEYRHVRLIHGHGTGRLKNALREWLSAHPNVEKLESDSRGGVTVVELKD